MITGIILASGFSKRMGQDKLLVEVYGKKLLEWTIIACKKSILDEIIIIYRNQEIKEIADLYKLKSFYNHKAHLGQAESLKLGLQKAQESNAYMFLVGDQPFISSFLINQLIAEYKNNQSKIIIPYYKEKRGTPTIFPASFKQTLLKTKGDKGGRDLIKNNPALVKKIQIKDEKLGFDIDNEEDLKQFYKIINKISY